ncbi:MAG: intradiol ring-cleavage dioxygenase [Candidatus Thiodiazotropha sp. (ex Lucinoma borealis)]|nr:intradiol ring-cleavage dioxygenase [Candidatus Thiodiazotropha sp. (ex Lucinoma borealis)]
MNNNRLYSRRKLLQNSLTVASALLLPVTTSNANTGSTPTPYQTPGPFYPKHIPLDSDNNLVDVKGRNISATGQVTHIFGRLLDMTGRPITNAQVEIWQCDANGFYHHNSDRGGNADPNFQGFGKMAVSNDGSYRFRTIRPMHYPGRAPHIHFRVVGNGFEALTTQMYVAGDPRNTGDFILNSVRDPQARASLVIPLEPAAEVEPNALAGLFNIVLGLNTVL